MSADEENCARRRTRPLLAIRTDLPGRGTEVRRFALVVAGRDDPARCSDKGGLPRLRHESLDYLVDTEALRQRVRELAHARVRFGYRRICMLLRREGWELGKNRLYRVYCEENLALRRKRPWRHVSAVHRTQKQPAGRPNEVWGMDFVADQLSDGRKIRTLTIVDLFTRECLGIEVGYSLWRGAGRSRFRWTSQRTQRTCGALRGGEAVLAARHVSRTGPRISSRVGTRGAVWIRIAEYPFAYRIAASQARRSALQRAAWRQASQGARSSATRLWHS
jgi:hypothetical protein